MVNIDGFDVNARSIPTKQLVSIWRTLTSQQFPNVRAFWLEDEDFEYVLQLRKCKEDEKREIEEWGKVLSTKGTDACVFNAEEGADVDYIILIRDNPYHRPQEILEHELRHIARGDL